MRQAFYYLVMAIFCFIYSLCIAMDPTRDITAHLDEIIRRAQQAKQLVAEQKLAEASSPVRLMDISMNNLKKDLAPYRVVMDSTRDLTKTTDVISGWEAN